MTPDAFTSLVLACLLAGAGGAVGSGVHRWAVNNRRWQLAEIGLSLSLLLPFVAFTVVYALGLR